MKTSKGTRIIGQVLAWITLLAALSAAPLRADVLVPGQLGVTRFSGQEAQSGRIDENGPVFVGVDVGPSGGERLAERVRASIPASQTGQVFGLALDDGRDPAGQAGPPNIYLTATSAFGLRIVDPATGTTLPRGLPTAAWMPGQFGPADKGGGPGSVWRVDGRTGAVTLLATIRAFGGETGAASLGAIAFDPASRMLYISDLSTGFIHRIGLDGTDFGYFDHGVEARVLTGSDRAIPADPTALRGPAHPQFEPQNPASWGFARRERLVYGLGIRDSRLYYAVAAGPQIWSVGLAPDGSFAGDARIEVADTGSARETQVTEIAFDAAGIMYLAERTAPGLEAAASADGTNPAAIRRFALTATPDGSGQSWAPLADRLPGGAAGLRVAMSGGLALGPGEGGACEAALWLTTGPARLPGADPSGQGETPRGLQRFAVPVAGAKGPAASLVADDAGVADRPGAHSLGQLKALAPCPQAVASGAPAQSPAATRGPLLYVEQSCKPCPVGGACTCRVSLVNRGRDAAQGPVAFVSAATILGGPQAAELRGVRESAPDGAQWNCNWLMSRYRCQIDGASLRPGSRRYVDLVIDTRDLVEAGNIGLQNCATLVLEGGREGQRVCAETGLDIAIAEKGPAQCVAGQPCLSQASVSNLTSQPFEGEVKISHSVTIPGRGQLGGSITITPPLDCQPAVAMASPLECTARISLAPGEVRIYDVAVTYEGSGATSPVRGVLCATATTKLLDLSMLMPGMPPAPLAGPGYECRPFRLLPEGSATGDMAAGGGSGSTGQGQPGAGSGGQTTPGGGAGQGQPGAGGGGQTEAGGSAGQGLPGAGGGGQTAPGGGAGQGQPGSGAGGPTVPGEAGGGQATPGVGGTAGGQGPIQCPAGTIVQGTQCACPRDSIWKDNSCAPSGGGGQGGPGCADGRIWNGAVCVADAGGTPPGGPGSGGAYPIKPGDDGKKPQTVCEPPFTLGAQGCACPDKTRWTGLRCEPAVNYDNPDYGGMAGPGPKPTPTGPSPTPTGPSPQPAGDDSPIDYGGMSGPPCPDGQVRGGDGKCICPPWLESVTEGGTQLCCLVPCPPGMKRVNAQCVPDTPPAPPTPPAQSTPKCPAGWAGVHPTCCPPPQTFVNGACQQPVPQTPAPTPPTPATPTPPPVFKCPDGWSGVHPTCCPPPQIYANGQCEAPAVAPVPVPVPIPVPVPVPCGNGMVGVPPNCYCPQGTQLEGGRCLAMQCPGGTNGVWPVCCPEPARYVNGRCERAPVAPPPPPVLCRGDMEGRYPNCYCPAGTQDNGQRCVTIRQPECRADMIGQYPNCACPQGTQDDGRRCVIVRQPECRADMAGRYPNCYCPQGTQDDGQRCVPVRQPECRADMEGRYPNCYCPRGTQDDGRRCVTIRQPECRADMEGRYPNCECPRGTQDNGSRCVPVPRLQCRDDMDGRYPNCFCPRGTQDNGQRCIPVRQPECRGDMVGTPPDCRCPPGFADNGRRCIPQPRPQCRGDMTGTPPNCQCPPGMQDNGQRCVPVSCPPGMVGRQPNCACPAGTSLVNGRCQQAECGRGMVGTPPNCACPPGTHMSRYQRRCVPNAQPTPGPKPDVSCPDGYRKLDKPNKYGALCEIIPKPGPTPTTPTQPKCPLEKTCVQWGKGAPGTLGGPCIKYEMRPNCPVIVR